MEYQVILDNKWGTLRYQPKHKYVYHNFHKPVTGQPFRQFLDVGLETLKKNKTDRWLSDNRNLGKFDPADVEYSVTDWGPRASKAGWKYWALVVPEDIAGRASMQNHIETFHGLGVWVRVFTNLEEARDWIIEVGR